MRTRTIAAVMTLALTAPAAAQGGGNTIPVSFCGTVVEGVECTLFLADGGAGLFVVGGLAPFGEGARIWVQGDWDPTCITICQQGNGCIFNATITPLDSVFYCTGKVNSAGCVPFMTADPGNPQFGGPAWNVTANDVLEQKPGLIFYGFGRANIPFLGGTLCVDPPLFRTPVQLSGGSPPPPVCSGELTLDVTTLLVPFVGTPVTIDLQAWSRDPADPTGSSLSSAVEVTICP